jgi:hypothetical protein
MKKHFIYTLIFFFVAFPLKSQNIVLYDFNVSDYPNVTANFFLFDSEGKWIRNLSPSDIEIYEKGEKLDVEFINCPDEQNYSSLSSVVTIDRSSSMTGTNLEKAKTAAQSWIELQEPYFETALTIFNENCVLLSGFSQDKSKLISLLDLFEADGKTSFNHGFIFTPAGALRVARNGIYSRAIVFISDGEGDCDHQEIIRQANENNIKIYSVAIENTAVRQLHDIAVGTGGAVFENIVDQDDLATIARAIQTLAGDNTPCTIRWQSKDCSSVRSVTAKYPKYGIDKNIRYFVDFDELALPYLDIIPRNALNFGDVEQGSFGEMDLTLTARDGEVVVENIIPSLGEFYISDMGGRQFPVVLNENDSWKIKIRYNSPDDLRRVCNFTVDSDICQGKSFFAVAGLIGSGERASELTVVFPNGGEKLVAGKEYDLRWTTSSNADELSLSYSIDKGSTWQEIGYSGDPGTQTWLAPIVESDDCLFRVEQKGAYELDSIVYDSDQQVNAICWSPAGGTILSGHNDQYLYKNDSYNLTKDFLNRAHLDDVLAVDWSGDAGRYASASSYIRVWDNTLGNEIARFRAEEISEKYETISFISDGTKIASNYLDNIIIWDIETESEEKRIQMEDEVSAVDWDSESGRIAVGDSRGNFYVVDPVSNQILHKEFGGSRIYDVRWNSSGDAILIVSHSSVTVIDGISYKLIFRVSVSHPDILLYADWNPAGNKIVLAESMGSINIIDIENPASTNRQVTPFQGIEGVRWSPAGDQIAIISNDDIYSIIYIYNIVTDDEDQSDSLWSIIIPELEMKDVDFAPTEVNQTRDSLVSAIIFNNENYSIDIESISLTGNDKDHFSVLSNTKDLIIEANSSIELKLRYEPLDLNSHSAELEVKYYNQTATALISGSSFEKELSINTINIDFGNVPVGITADTMAIVIEMEKGDFAQISNYYLEGADSDKFFLDPILPFDLTNENPTKELKIAFQTDSEGMFSSSIVFETEQSDEDVRSWLIASSYEAPEKGEALISLPTLSAATKQIIPIPISIKLGSDVVLKEDTYFFAEIAFNKTVLYPENGTDLGRINQEYRIIKAENILIKQGKSENEPYYLDFLVTLGNSVDTDLEFLNAGVYDYNLEVRTSDGYFSVSDICYEGGTRLIEGGETFSLAQNYPNPVDNTTSFQFTSIEKGIHTVAIYDFFGRKVTTIFKRSIENDQLIDFEVDLTNLNSGIYYYELQTPSMTRRRKLIKR